MTRTQSVPAWNMVQLTPHVYQATCHVGKTKTKNRRWVFELWELNTPRAQLKKIKLKTDKVPVNTLRKEFFSALAYQSRVFTEGERKRSERERRKMQNKNSHWLKEHIYFSLCVYAALTGCSLLSLHCESAGEFWCSLPNSAWDIWPYTGHHPASDTFAFQSLVLAEAADAAVHRISCLSSQPHIYIHSKPKILGRNGSGNSTDDE